MENYHIPVLLQESVDGLDIKPDGIYVDVTYGGGGHSAEILRRLSPKGKLIAFDCDTDAYQNRKKDDRLIFVQHNFKFLRNFLRYHCSDQVDGILADLGVSSHHFDAPERGFSFRFEGELDMRMNRNTRKTAAEVLNNYTKEEMILIFREYGEIENAGKLAQTIENNRKQEPLKTISQFTEAISNCIPKFAEHKYLAKVFQALRIEVNGEMDNLKRFLNQTIDVLKIGGRLSVITYHSLEDRLVKNFIRSGNFEGEAPQDMFGNRLAPLSAVNRKIIVPTDAEIEINNRARSAKLRIAEKIEIKAKNNI